MSETPVKTFVDPLLERNPVVYQMLGICPALAISTAMENALAMGLATVAVLAVSNTAISAIRNLVPENVRIIIYLVIVASLVIIADQVLRAFYPELSQALSVYVGLIITNCIVLGRAEAFAAQNKAFPSLLDGVGSGLGYALVLVTVAFFRELLGAGALFGVQVLPTAGDGGWFHTVGLLSSPAGAFFVIMVLIWALRAWKTDQIEEA
ncbi:MAG: NADH:ubiquinone reductase (Na(+)-transporting) subunit D [Gammaproteobacteria bacterium]